MTENKYKFTYNSFSKGSRKKNKVCWEIFNFKQLVNDTDNQDLCMTTTAKDYEDNESEDIKKFQLKMKFRGTRNDLIEIYYLTPEPVSLDLSFCIDPGSNKNEIYVQKLTSGVWHFLLECSRKDLLYEFDRTSNLKSLKITCLFTFDTRIKLYNNCDLSKPQLNHEFQNLLNNSIYYDVTIKSAEGTAFHVHKAVLATRSAVLKAHFEHNTLETVTNIIASPLPTDVLQEVLTYIYTDDAPKVDEMPEKLLAAADFYQLNRLKSLCEEELYKKLTEDNAIEILQLADLHSDTNLKKMTIQFINDDRAKQIIKTESWTRMKSVALVQAIFEDSHKCADRLKS